MAVKVAIIYYSATGTTYTLARAIEEGAKAAPAFNEQDINPVNTQKGDRRVRECPTR